jgi:hypothetical protein
MIKEGTAMSRPIRRRKAAKRFLQVYLKANFILLLAILVGLILFSLLVNK